MQFDLFLDWVWLGCIMIMIRLDPMYLHMWCSPLLEFVAMVSSLYVPFSDVIINALCLAFRSLLL